jgi:hypothetical protein
VRLRVEHPDSVRDDVEADHEAGEHTSKARDPPLEKGANLLRATWNVRERSHPLERYLTRLIRGAWGTAFRAHRGPFGDGRPGRDPPTPGTSSPERPRSLWCRATPWCDHPESSAP